MKSIVIPAYNEAENIEQVVMAVLELGDVEVIISDDGSTDGTNEIARSLAELENVFLVSGENRGKGAAIKRGLKVAGGDILGFLDADMSAHPDEFLKLLKELYSGADIVIGSRDLPASQISVKQPIYRRVLGDVYRTITRHLFAINIRDFQCGLKIFRREVWDNVTIDTDGFVFDTEFIAKAHKKGYTIKEVPITWQNSPKSKVDPVSDSIKMFVELIKIRCKI